MPSQTVAESIAAALAQRRILADPITFLRAAGVMLDPWQEEVITCDDRQVLLNCSRQSGKSMITSAVTIYTALTQPKSRALVVSKGERQAQLLLASAINLYRDTGRPVPALRENTEQVTLANGSWIGAVPGKSETIRGISALDLLAVDEAAFVPDELIMSVRPMLAVKKGRLFALSSPFGKRGWFYDAWMSCEEAQKRGEPEPWRRFSVTADQCPRIDREWLANERRSMGDYWFLQEFYCRFLDATTQLFGTEHIEAALQEDVGEWALPEMPTVEFA